MKVWMLFASIAISKISYAQNNALTEVSPTTKGASVTLKVTNYGEIRKQLVIASLKHKAKLVDSKTNVSGKGRKYGWFRISVPHGELESLLSEIRPIGVMSGEQLTTRNRKAELNELDLRRSRMVVHVERLKGLLSNARRLRASDTLFIQNLLLRAETDTDLLEHSRQKIVGTIDNASVLVTSFESGQETTPLPTGWTKIKTDLWGKTKEFTLELMGYGVGLVKYLIIAILLFPFFKILWPKMKNLSHKIFPQDSK